MTRDQLLSLDDDELFARCRMDRFRASGPGGQHRNKTDSAVRLTLEDAPEIVASASDHRSQHRNRALAVDRLRFEIALQWREPPTPWTDSWDIGRRDRRYPRLAATLLDALASHQARVGEAARALGLSTGRMIRLLAADPQLWQAANNLRRAAGQRPLSMPN